MEGRRLYFGGFDNKIARLFHKNESFYKGIVHEKIQIEGSLGKLKGNLNHYTFRSMNQFKTKIEYYAELKALDLYSKQKNVTLYHEFMKPVLRFFIHYFLKLGVLNGYRGFQFSYILSYGVWKRFKLLKKLNNK